MDDAVPLAGADHTGQQQLPLSLVELSDALPAVGTPLPPSFSIVFIDNQDLVLELAKALREPIRPCLVHLSSTVKSLRAALRLPLAELRQLRQEAEAMVAGWGESLALLRDDPEVLELVSLPIALANWRTLGMLVGCGTLWTLVQLDIRDSDYGDEGVAALAAGVRRAALPRLKDLSLDAVHIGPQGASAIAGFLTKEVLPSLEFLSLDGNHLGDAGLTALAEGLRTLPGLMVLSLGQNSIGDEGMASLLAEPMANKLSSLQRLHLSDNWFTDAGCAMLTCALRDGSLPALQNLYLYNNPTSRQALDALNVAAGARRPFRQPFFFCPLGNW